MQQKLTRRIALPYLGCKIIFDDSVIGVLAGVTTKLLTDLIVIEEMDNGTPIFKEWCSQDCKLILTPLASISDDDAIEVARIILPAHFVGRKTGWIVSRDNQVNKYTYLKVWNPKKVCSVQIDTALVNFDVDGEHDRETGQYDMSPVAVVDFLREKGYDCGYGPFKSLINVGIAIDATKLNK